MHYMHSDQQNDGPDCKQYLNILGLKVTHATTCRGFLNSNILRQSLQRLQQRHLHGRSGCSQTTTQSTATHNCNRSPPAHIEGNILLTEKGRLLASSTSHANTSGQLLRLSNRLYVSVSEETHKHNKLTGWTNIKLKWGKKILRNAPLSLFMSARCMKTSI